MRQYIGALTGTARIQARQGVQVAHMERGILLLLMEMPHAAIRLVQDIEPLYYPGD